ncbi:MAG TPA: TRAP transporter substrate-binding protein [Rhodopila sp.]|nr:TRAP transporter substrate-binding protein [Rhodopila sp.]
MDIIDRFLRAVVSCIARWTCCAGMGIGVLAAPNAQAADEAIQLKVVGGLAGVSQYTKLEEPFWTQRIIELSNGRVHAEIHPFDRSGLPGNEMLRLMQLGVVSYGTALLALVSADEPELNAVDLPALNPDIASLRRTVELYRDHLHSILQQKYGIELLAIYAYPAQVLYCNSSFRSLNDLAGRRIRTSSVGQSEMMSALGAIPTVLAFSDIVSATRNHVVDCAITGTMSGGEIGLPEVMSYISPFAISWGVSFFGANRAAWDRLPADVRAELRDGIHALEQSIWTAADQETAGGLACDIGAAGCKGGRVFHMTLVPATPDDEALRKRLLTQSILPRWIQRCGNSCVSAWNNTLGVALEIPAEP